METLEAKFRRMVERNVLRHGYLLFGADRVALFHIARSIASLLEKGVFEEADSLRELFFATGKECEIGIDVARAAQAFLLQRPIFSSHRVVIIDYADRMTDAAQNALLKISEEAPSYALIMLLAVDAESLLATIRSRLQQIYIPSVRTHAVTEEHADTAKAFLRASAPGRAQIIKDIVSSDNDKTSEFLSSLIQELGTDVHRNASLLAFVLEIERRFNEVNVNRRLQLQAISSRMGA